MSIQGEDRQALEQMGEIYRTLFDTVEQGLCILEVLFDEEEQPVDYRFLEVNPSFEKQTGLRDAQGKTIRELVPGINDFWIELYGRVAQTGIAERAREHDAAMGRWFDVTGFRVGAPESKRVAVLFRDVSEERERERKAEFFAELSRDFSRLGGVDEILAEVMPKIADYLSVDGLIFSAIAEETASVVHEWCLEELPGHEGSFFLPDLLSEEARRNLEQGFALVIDDTRRDPRTGFGAAAQQYDRIGNRSVVIVPHMSEGRCKNHLLSYCSEPHRWSYHEVDVMREVTARLALRVERARVEEALRESEQRIREIADTAPAVLWMTDRENRTIFMSRSWEELTGQSREDGLGFGWLETVHAEDRARAQELFLTAAAKRMPLKFDYRQCCWDGEYRWVIDIGHPRFDEEGNWLGYIGTVVDVHDRKMHEAALEEANERKNRFLAVLSHELRNPLTPIKLNLQLLDLVEPKSAEAQEARAGIERQVDLLSRLVDDLLDVTRITRDKVKLQLSEVDLRDIARDTVDDHRPLFEVRGIELEIDLDTEPVVVRGDADRLTQILGNLLQNAAKFTGAEGTTTVYVERVEELACLRVSDTGIGMSENTLSELFEPFTQADISLAHSSGGLGLGLALVKGLVELHDGKVEARSRGLGAGTEFRVSLPRIDAAAERQARATESSSQEKRILLIEDNVDVAAGLRTVLTLKGHQVDVAYNGLDGLKAAKAFAPEVIICDIGLPGLSGYEVARALREMPQFADLHLVALSGYAMPEDVKKAHAAGFDRHLAKPVDLKTLEKVLAARG